MPFASTLARAVLVATLGIAALTAPARAAPGTYTQLHQFVGTDGRQPWATLVLGSDGKYYGTTQNGGAHNGGTVFSMAPADNAVTRLFSFTFGSDGAEPHDGLVEGPDGRLYGTASTGGDGLNGVVFAITKQGKLTVLHSFHLDASDTASHPIGAPVFGPDGALYGTTQAGGAADLGTVWRLALDGSYSILWAFAHAGRDPVHPDARLLLGGDGRLYGTSVYGGADNLGTVFRVAADGSSHKVLHAFTPGSGNYPEAPLVQGRNGRLYGAARQGGLVDGTQSLGNGGVFTLTTTGGGYRDVIRFSGQAGDPVAPWGGLIEGEDGVFYGTSQSIGIGGSGSIYRVRASSGAVQILHTFTSFVGDGWDARSTLLRNPDGEFLGTTYYGGDTRSDGTIFKWAPKPAAAGR
jgi:uncharacterized repeat protein (TIGR03803 family)